MVQEKSYTQNDYSHSAPIAANPGYPQAPQPIYSSQQPPYPPPTGYPQQFAQPQQQYGMNQQSYPQQAYNVPQSEQQPPVKYDGPQEGERFRPKKVTPLPHPPSCPFFTPSTIQPSTTRLIGCIPTAQTTYGVLSIV